MKPATKEFALKLAAIMGAFASAALAAFVVWVNSVDVAPLPPPEPPPVVVDPKPDPLPIPNPPPPVVTPNVTMLIVGGNPLNSEPYTVRAETSDDLQAKGVSWGIDGVYAGSTPAPSPFDITTAYDGKHYPPRLFGHGLHTATCEISNAQRVVENSKISWWEGGPPPAPPHSPLFSAKAIWNTPIDKVPVHAQSAGWLAYSSPTKPLHRDFGAPYAGRLNGIPINYVAGKTVPKAAIEITVYAAESDPVPPEGLPIPVSVVIEGDFPTGTPDEVPGNDQHCLIVDTDTNVLHEFYHMTREAGGTYSARGYARWNLGSLALRPDGWTSMDAAGLPIAPLLTRYDEALAAVYTGGTIPHALRFTLRFTHGPHSWPARHDANSGAIEAPPFGARVRLKADVDLSGLSPINQAIGRTLKKYGMFLADNGGDWFLGGVPDERWKDSDLQLLFQKPAEAFEWVDAGGLMVDPNTAEAK